MSSAGLQMKYGVYISSRCTSPAFEFCSPDGRYGGDGADGDDDDMMRWMMGRVSSPRIIYSIPGLGDKCTVDDNGWYSYEVCRDGSGVKVLTRAFLYLSLLMLFLVLIIELIQHQQTKKEIQKTKKKLKQARNCECRMRIDVSFRCVGLYIFENELTAQLLGDAGPFSMLAAISELCSSNFSIIKKPRFIMQHSA